ncbi:MAG: hypothetical protein AB7G35_21465 [Hyphomicrobiaceae bacterium]
MTITLSKRIKRGFWRIGAAGLFLGVVIGLIASGKSIVVLLFEQPSIYYRGVFHKISANASQSDFERLVSQARSQPPAGSWVTPDASPVVTRAQHLRDEMLAERQREAAFALYIPVVGVGIGLVWLGLWWGVGWIVSGFLE